MNLSKERILYLLNAYSNNEAAESEEKELFAWVNATNNHELLRTHIQKVIERNDAGQFSGDVDFDHLYDRILGNSVNLEKQPGPYRMSWLRWSAAAIIILFGAIAFLYMNQSSAKKVMAAVVPKKVTNDVAAPASSKAVLTLANGSKIQLDSINNGTLAREGNVKIMKQPDGGITYNGSANEDLYNTLNVPRGSKVVSIRLSDGTQVWLNSESSLRYPASFKGTERKVEITGEAYFEVAHNSAMPFVVKKDAMEVRVLGTHFNVDTYGDEGINKVTLLEGSIKISLNNRQNLLKPGQQAQLNDNIKLVNGVDLEEVMAWKNGKFQFGEKADLHVIMKQIARWYDVDVDYEGAPINQRFGGELPMSSNLSQVLEILRISGVNFTIDGKKVIVKA